MGYLRIYFLYEVLRSRSPFVVDMYCYNEWQILPDVSSRYFFTENMLLSNECRIFRRWKIENLGNFSLSTYNDSYSKLYFRRILGRCSSETAAQFFPSEYREIFQNYFFCRTPLVAASDTLRLLGGLFKKLTMNSHEKRKQIHIIQLYSRFC